jgi:hypothetical protein
MFSIDHLNISTSALRLTRVLYQMRERIRHMQYSLSTEQVPTYWMPLFIRWSG